MMTAREGLQTTAAPDHAGRESRLIVAGVDGSGCGRHAVHWAAAEADRRGGSLLLVHSYYLPAAGFSGYNPFPGNVLPDLRDNGRAVLDDTAAALRRGYPLLDITTRMVYGDSATVLRKESRDAALTVLGSHGANRVRVALGSVAAALAANSPVPVTVVHPGDEERTGPVLLGLDGPDTGDEAIAFAFASAALRSAPLTVVRCWTDRDLDGPFPAYVTTIVEPQRIQHAESAVLAARLEGWAERYPGVELRQVVIHDLPAPALLDLSRTATLVVVGNRGHAGVSGVVLGSTGQALIAQSACPVVVVRSSSGA